MPLPSSWTQVTVGQVANSALGKMLDKAKNTGRPLPYLRNQSVRWDAFDLSDLYEMRFDDDELDRFGLRQGDLLICEGGEPGRAAVWDGAIPEMKFQKAIHRVRPGAALNPRYLMFRLRQEAAVGELEKHFTGTTIKHFTGVALDRYTFPLPPRSEQERIVAKLDAVFAQTRAAKARLERLPGLIETLKRSILAAAFRGDLTADWRAANPDVEPASNTLDRFFADARDEAPSRRTGTKVRPSAIPSTALPRGWQWSTIESVGDVLLGRRRADAEYVAGEDGRSLAKYIRVANVKLDRLDLDDLKEMPFDAKELSLYRLLPGDIILSEGQSPEKVGQSAIYEGGMEDLCIQATVHRFRAHNAIVSPAYAQLVFMHHLLTGLFQRASSQTVNIAHLTSERLRPLPFPVPPRAEQEALVALTRALLDAAAAIAGRVSGVCKAFESAERSALAAAFRGELVPQDPTDEPATVMLARIRAAKADDAAPTRRSRTSAAAAAPYVVPPAITLTQAAESGPLFMHAHDRQQRAATDAPPLDLVVAALQQCDGRLTSAAIAQATGLDGAAVRQALKELVAAGQVRTHGKARGTAYEWTG